MKLTNQSRLNPGAKLNNITGENKMGLINIEGINKAEILAALYNKSQPLGMGIIHFQSVDMSVNEAEELLKQDTYFDYLKGRIMKIDLSGNGLRTSLYDRDNGDGAALNAIKHLLK